MKTSETIQEITKAYMECQKELKNLSPDADGYNYKYLTLHKLISETKPILIKNNIVCVQSVGCTENGVSVTTRLQHISGEYFEDTFNLPPTNSKTMNEVQAMGSSISYGRRYGMGAILGIAVDEDNDGGIFDKKEDKTSFKLDFDAVGEELTHCATIEDVNKYSKILMTEYPDMTEKQKTALGYKFKQRRSEIQATDKTKKEFQGEVFDDSNIPY